MNVICKALLAVAICLGVVFSAGAFEVIHHPSGATVVLKHEPERPVASVHLWLRAGSLYEQGVEHGMSHFLEHVLFKGARDLAPGEVELLVEGFGGRMNAATGKDFVFYHITAADRFAARSVEILGNMVLFPALIPTEIEKEKPVVVEEILQSLDNPYARQFEALSAQLFRGHPYSRNILGTIDSVNSFDRAQLQAFHRRLYHPANLAIVVAGGFERDAVLAAIDAVVQDAAVPVVRERPSVQRPALLVRPHFSSIEHPGVQVPSLAIGYRAPAAYELDSYALAVLSEILSGGVNAVFTTDFVDTGRLHSAIGRYSPGAVAGTFFLSAAYDEALSAHEVHAMLIDRLKVLYAQLLTGEADRLVSSAKDRMRSREIFRQQRVSSMASELGRAFVYGQWDEYTNYWEAIDGVSAQHIARALKVSVLRPAFAAVELR
ncbi:peptidase M16 domain protein [Desulfurispirillum indicum S5]|uniref:Peptidase M16 domain protein n=1 Tax=Desulfurispirillum indicum (strain ATCC BAA-1389 / DSM 22839 / S5) TaxID=653733 RepID=E6W375_DESIS|nr:pitrilysin family protein [Desulfurispirillum indicum]ADU66829.1 peptidase M16 domain protein [Desulfurispirillum indicum S5]